MKQANRQTSRKIRDRKKGAICLEAAVTLPFILMLTAQFISLIMMSRAEIIMEGALDRTASEISLLSPLCEKLADWQAEGVQTQKSSESKSDILIELMHEFFPGQDLAAMIGDATLDLASSALLGQFIHCRLDFWLKGSFGDRTEVPSCYLRRKIFLDWKLSGNQLWLCVSWEFATPLGTVSRLSESVVPLWIGKTGITAAAKENEVWQMDNFSRGKYLRQLFGANLPYDFPVIASLNQSEALSIKSADLTAPTYRSPDEVRSLLTEQINKLAGFSSAHYSRKGLEIIIESSMIDSRLLLLVIPENSQQPWLDALMDEMALVAGNSGVKLQIVRYGQSSRYSPAPVPDDNP